MPRNSRPSGARARQTDDVGKTRQSKPRPPRQYRKHLDQRACVRSSDSCACPRWRPSPTVFLSGRSSRLCNASGCPHRSDQLALNAWFGDVEIGPDLVTLARKIHVQFDRDLADGTIHRTRVRNEPTKLLADKSFGGAIHATQLGRIRVPRLPGNLVVDDITSSHASALGPAIYTFLYGREVSVYTIDSLNQRLRVGFLAGSYEKSDELLAYIEDELTAAIDARI